jgi:uncharacterized protein with von Willebrand factor type A (vWA) domain
MRNLVCGATAAVLFIVLPAAHAQHKCVDAKGKVTYQQDHCPGAVRAPAPAPAAPARPAAPAGPSERSQAAELTEQGKCVSDWELIAGNLQRSREEIASLRASEGDTAREEKVNQQYVEASMARFLPACGKYGFQEPRDEQAIQANAAAARDLQRRMNETRAALDTAAAREAAKQSASGRVEKAKPPPTIDCRKTARQISQGRAGVVPLENIDELEREYRKQCS